WLAAARGARSRRYRAPTEGHLAARRAHVQRRARPIGAAGGRRAAARRESPAAQNASAANRLVLVVLFRPAGHGAAGARQPPADRQRLPLAQIHSDRRWIPER